MFCERKLIFILILILQAPLESVICTPQGDQVSKWANEIGTQLWLLGTEVTHLRIIAQNYNFLHATVGEKHPSDLLKDIQENILRMMDRKMDAITCIQQEAENAAEKFLYCPYEFKYYSSKWSCNFESEIDTCPNNESRIPSVPETLKEHISMYKNFALNNDTHFYNLPVNTNHSSVHVPTNVLDRADKVAEAILWSEALDKIFIQNYKADPALSWQYFGSVTGIMRHYPAMHWDEKKNDPDLFDCRIRTWFIEAATCTKDIVILIDNSGSMDGMGRHIGALTANSILDTLSNNDYVNILYYSEKADYVVPCFENQLIQATSENIDVFKEALKKLDPDGKTNVDAALNESFRLLKKYRDERNCETGNSSNCNQAIMILTDGLNANYSDTVLRNNGENIPVRIFSYLIGREVTNVEYSIWMSCANRGYYTHVTSLEQVTTSILQYIYVVARPLVLQGEVHPVSWTHAYMDETYDDATDTTINEPFRLLTSAAIPIFDTKINKMNDSRTAELLGVAGTDVPIDEFRKLTQPYKIGVNAFAFIVSNNGFVLMHPGLSPIHKGVKKLNYNSVDLTEVEQHEGLRHREMGKSVIELRNALVEGMYGSLHNITLKYHYDDYKRVAEEMYDYYYAPLGKKTTPFSVAIAIPNRYGNYSIDVGDEIQKNRHTGENLTSFFIGKWKVHPKWIYCRYHYLEGHEFNTSEEELLHFVGKMYEPDFKWEPQYATMEKEDINEVECGRKTLEDDDYYCDKDLVQRLIFDARNTYEPFKEKLNFQQFEETLNRYNVTLRFVATMSGLTRWDYIYDDYTKSKTKPNREFGDLNPRAIDEKWYKSAVLQHQYDNESFVYSVPFNDQDISQNKTSVDVLVTASYAVFVNNVSNSRIEAPGSVVGFQFSQAKFKARVDEVSTNISAECSHCDICGQNLICYVVDSSGYIVVSEEDSYTGKFFGQIEGDLFATMLQENIFLEKILYDYQAMCPYPPKENGTGTSNVIHTPLYYVTAAIQWITTKIFYTLMEMNLYQMLDPLVTLAQDNDTVAQDDGNSTSTTGKPVDNITKEKDKTEYFACETEIKLYLLQQSLFIKDNFHGELSTADNRIFYVKRIPHSNLIFVAAEWSLNMNGKQDYTTEPTSKLRPPDYTSNETMNETLLSCQKLYLNTLSRRRLTGCYNEHYLEHEIQACGRSTMITYNAFFLIGLLFHSIVS